MPAPLLVFADDWGRHPSSAQHLIRRLLPHRRVVWVNTIGTRKPKFDHATLQRGFEKLRQWSKPQIPPEPLPENLTVVSPRMWPWFTHSWDRAVNATLLTRSLKRLIKTLPEPPIAVTTLPVTADLIGAIPVRRWIYYCVDDFSVWPGLDGATLQRMEERLVQRVDRVIAVSETLRRRLAGMGCESELLTHGVDLAFWRAVGEPLPEFAALPKPLVVFWGVIDRRMDTAFLQKWSESVIGTLLLVGPQNDPDPALHSLPRVMIGPALRLEQLPRLAQMAAVLVMPYADLPVTRAMQPLKLKEYLATGLPVIVRDLPANRDWADCLDLVDSPETFMTAIQRRLQEGVPESQRLARMRLEQESWDEKARQFERFLDAV